jgi:hypothetical protein
MMLFDFSTSFHVCTLVKVLCSLRLLASVLLTLGMFCSCCCHKQQQQQQQTEDIDDDDNEEQQERELNDDDCLTK